MNVSLLNEHYNAEEARELLSNIIQAKIAFHVRRLSRGCRETNEADEQSISEMKKCLRDLLNELPTSKVPLNLKATLEVASVE